MACPNCHQRLDGQGPLSWAAFVGAVVAWLTAVGLSLFVSKALGSPFYPDLVALFGLLICLPLTYIVGKTILLCAMGRPLSAQALKWTSFRVCIAIRSLSQYRLYWACRCSFSHGSSVPATDSFESLD